MRRGAFFCVNRLWFVGRLRTAIDDASHEAAASPPEEAVYDVDAAAEVFAAIFRDQRPRDVLREHGFDVEVDSSDLSSCSRSDFGIAEAHEPQPSHSRDVEQLALSPVPEDPSPHNAEAQAHYLRQRSRWRRILRTALPLQVCGTELLAPSVVYVARQECQLLTAVLVKSLPHDGFRQCWCSCSELRASCHTATTNTAASY